MPKSSSALAASFMISRSESDPITMETRGLSAIECFPVSLFRRFQCSRANIFAVIHFFKTDQPHRFVCASDRIFQLRCPRCHTQHSSSTGIENAIALAGPGMEYLYVAHGVGVVQSGNLFSCHKASRISGGRNHHAAGSFT